MCIFPLLSNPHRAAISLSYSKQKNNNWIYETVSIFLSCYPDTFKLLQPSTLLWPWINSKINLYKAATSSLNILEILVSKRCVFFLCFLILTEPQFHSQILGRKITIESAKRFPFSSCYPDTFRLLQVNNVKMHRVQIKNSARVRSCDSY